MSLPPPDARAGVHLGERRSARVGAHTDVRRGGSDPGPDLGTELTDVSADGASVRLTAPVLPRDKLAVGLGRADGRVVARLEAVVRWCRPLGGGLFAAGREFDRPLTLTELARLVR